MEKCAPQNGCFFVRFVTFTGTFIYSVVWESFSSHIMCNKKYDTYEWLNAYLKTFRKLYFEIYIGGYGQNQHENWGYNPILKQEMDHF